jgi:hypothetical protein
MTTPTDWRALCADLTDALDTWLMAHHHGGVPPQDGVDAKLVLRARTALAQPEPQGPQQEAARRVLEYLELRKTSKDLDPEVIGQACRGSEFPYVRKLTVSDLEALARWGRPAVEPVPAAERPWEREGWCDAHGRCWWGRPSEELCNSDWFLATRSEVEEFCEDCLPTVSLPHWALPVPEREP